MLRIIDNEYFKERIKDRVSRNVVLTEDTIKGLCRGNLNYSLYYEDPDRDLVFLSLPNLKLFIVYLAEEKKDIDLAFINQGYLIRDNLVVDDWRLEKIKDRSDYPVYAFHRVYYEYAGISWMLNAKWVKSLEGKIESRALYRLVNDRTGYSIEFSVLFGSYGEVRYRGDVSNIMLAIEDILKTRISLSEIRTKESIIMSVILNKII